MTVGSKFTKTVQQLTTQECQLFEPPKGLACLLYCYAGRSSLLIHQKDGSSALSTHFSLERATVNRVDCRFLHYKLISLQS